VSKSASVVLSGFSWKLQDILKPSTLLMRTPDPDFFMRFLLTCIVLLACVDACVAEPLQWPVTLNGTEPLQLEIPLDVEMVAGIDRFALKEIEAFKAQRSGKWKLDVSSRAAYEQSLSPYRTRFREIIGAVNPPVSGRGIEDLSAIGVQGDLAAGARVATAGEAYSIIPVRWQVLQNVTAQGVMLKPNREQWLGLVVALPDATWSPEEFCGADPAKPEASALPRWLAEQGILVLIPTLISRDDTWSGNPDIAMTNQSHREWIYRQSFELGRHVIGYEVEKVLAAVEQLDQLRRSKGRNLPIGVCGVGDGGLLSLYSAAIDPRIESTLVCGYFQQRENVWQEPIDRNVFSLLTLFGDAELAGMIAPRSLTIEACRVPEVVTPAPVKPGRRGGAAPGMIQTAQLESVQNEFARAAELFAKIDASGNLNLVVSGENGTGPAGTIAAGSRFLAGMGIIPTDSNNTQRLAPAELVDGEARQQEQVRELSDYSQTLLKLCSKTRDKRWSGAIHQSLADWEKNVPALRDAIWDELIGRIPDPPDSWNPRSRRVFDEQEYLGYEVVLDVLPDVVAGGILLLPKDLKEGEKRPVVVCQHGLESVPMDTINAEGETGYPSYKSFAVQLVKRGLIVYCPQNPYRGGDRFRTLQRKSNPVGRSLFSYILPQHRTTLRWLATLPNVDAERVAFYGLSYGGKTAVRVPTLLPEYRLSICSADYNEWIYKTTTIHETSSYMFTGEYEIFEWNMGNIANYAELSYLMAPRPFMVERGHHDGVALDEWTAWEYAKVRRFYTELGIPDQTEIEFFNGPHTIHGQGTFDFLHRHLQWAEPKEKSP